MIFSIRDLKIPTIKEIIKEFCQIYCDRLEKHPNNLVANLMEAKGRVRKLKRKRPRDLLTIIDLLTSIL
jgi:hypothetical protein